MSIPRSRPRPWRCVAGAVALALATSTLVLLSAASPPAAAAGFRGHVGSVGHHHRVRPGLDLRYRGRHFGFSYNSGYDSFGLYGRRHYGGSHGYGCACTRCRSHGYLHDGRRYGYGRPYYRRNYATGGIGRHGWEPRVYSFTIPGSGNRSEGGAMLGPFSNAEQEIRPLVRTTPEVARVVTVPRVDAGRREDSSQRPSVVELRRWDPDVDGPIGTSLDRLPDREGPDGWALLVDGKTKDALAAFSAESIAEPSDGSPKAGYALAAAFGGHLDKAVWAMRRAFRIDPAPLRYVVGDDRLTPRIRSLIDRYQDTLAYPSRRVDATFMIAALSYLIHDDVEARAVIEKAVRDGDTSKSAENLLRLARAGRETATSLR